MHAVERVPLGVTPSRRVRLRPLDHTPKSGFSGALRTPWWSSFASVRPFLPKDLLLTEGPESFL